MNFNVSDMRELGISCLNCKYFESFRDAYDDDPLEPWDLGWCHHVIKTKDDPTAGLYYVCEYLELNQDNEKQ